MFNDLLVIGDSHIELIATFLKKDKYMADKLGLKKSKIHFVGVIGGSIKGLTKDKSTTNIRMKVENALVEHKIKTIMICLGFNDFNAIYPHKKQENHNLSFHEYTNNLIKMFYDLFLQSKNKKYKLIVQSIIPNPVMDSKNKYYRYLKSRKIINSMSNKEKDKIFNNYWKNLKYFNRKLEEMCQKHNIFFINNEKLYNLFYKYQKFTTSQKLDAPMHYKPIYNVLYLVDGMDKYFKNKLLKKDKMIILRDLTKYIINKNKSSDNIAFLKDLLDYYKI